MPDLHPRVPVSSRPAFTPTRCASSRAKSLCGEPQKELPRDFHALPGGTEVHPIWRIGELVVIRQLSPMARVTGKNGDFRTFGL
jgi:hypothetical protein